MLSFSRSKPPQRIYRPELFRIEGNEFSSSIDLKRNLFLSVAVEPSLDKAIKVPDRRHL